MAEAEVVEAAADSVAVVHPAVVRAVVGNCLVRLFESINEDAMRKDDWSVVLLASKQKTK